MIHKKNQRLSIKQKEHYNTKNIDACKAYRNGIRAPARHGARWRSPRAVPARAAVSVQRSPSVQSFSQSAVSSELWGKFRSVCSTATQDHLQAHCPRHLSNDYDYNSYHREPCACLKKSWLKQSGCQPVAPQSQCSGSGHHPPPPQSLAHPFPGPVVSTPQCDAASWQASWSPLQSSTTAI